MGYRLSGSLALCALFCLTCSFQALAKLSITGDSPEWRKLDPYQKTITHKKFHELVNTIYSIDQYLYEYLTVHEDRIDVYLEKEKQTKLWTLYLAKDETLENPFNRHQILKRKFSFNYRPLPLLGITICLDPGHIGGKWTKIEERHMQMRTGNYPPITEGDLTTITCRHVERILKAAGAKVQWTREDNEPVTDLRPTDLYKEALDYYKKSPRRSLRYANSSSLTQVMLWANLLFYRVFEIEARARRIEKLQPDMTLCVHFNAAPTPNPMRPRLYNVRKLVTFVHGSYTSEEIDDLWQRYHLFKKLLECSVYTEIEASDSITKRMVEMWGWPPENYDSWDTAHRAHPENPYIWSRNLLANRLYPGPVVFIEGPYMNDKYAFHRLVEGDYDGIRIIKGKPERSIFREFAETIAEGIIDFYSRPQKEQTT
ncbi:MAG: hypothetical protein AAF984_08400, partial [Verrucomicrobiota bacterium]